MQKLTTVLECLGMLLVVGGAWAYAYELGLIAAGVAMIAAGYLMARAGEP